MAVMLDGQILLPQMFDTVHFYFLRST
jgi:hypothetical protein